MAVMPECVRFLPCASGSIDEDTDRITLVEPFYVLHLPASAAFPFRIGPIVFYVHLISGLGKFYCRIEIHDESSKFVAKCDPMKAEFDGDNRFAGVEFLIQFPEWDVPALGVYRCKLFANYKPEPIGVTEIRFV